jgi:peptide/nickel transport system permease protein
VKALLLRTSASLGVVVVTAVIAVAIPRWARPDLYPGETGLAGVADGVERALLHLDFGVACGWPGCPSVHELWTLGFAADVSMLLGTIVIGIGSGFAMGLWCAGRTGMRRARVVENAASILYCAPVYVVGFGALMLFHGSFGVVPLPYFFDAAPVWASPFASPWDWFRTMLVPWLVAAAPLAAMCLRLVVVMMREQLESDPVRTAIAKGVDRTHVLRHHAGPFAYPATASLVGVSAPIVVINLVLVEHVFSVPGFFQRTWRATGHTDNPDWLFIDYPTLTGLAVWGSIFVVVLSFAMDTVVQRIDPRVRTVSMPRAKAGDG